MHERAPKSRTPAAGCRCTGTTALVRLNRRCTASRRRTKPALHRPTAIFDSKLGRGRSHRPLASSSRIVSPPSRPNTCTLLPPAPRPDMHASQPPGSVSPQRASSCLAAAAPGASAINCPPRRSPRPICAALAPVAAAAPPAPRPKHSRAAVPALPPGTPPTTTPTHRPRANCASSRHVG